MIEVAYQPDRGDVIWLDLNPVLGREQAKRRPVLVLTPQKFSRATGYAWVIPISSRIRGLGFEVPLNNTETRGVALTQHLRSVDFSYRHPEFIESAPTSVVTEALAKCRAMLT